MADKQTTTKKTTSRRTRVNTASDTAIVEKTVAVKEVAEKQFKDDDLIRCRSIFQGKLSTKGRKSGNKYIFEFYGDETNVELRDLKNWKSAKHDLLYVPRIVIADEDLLNTKQFEDLKKLYDKWIAQDISEILDLPLQQFKNALLQMPQGYSETLIGKIRELMLEDKFDSINKVRAVDEVFNTNLYSMLL